MRFSEVYRRYHETQAEWLERQQPTHDNGGRRPTAVLEEPKEVAPRMAKPTVIRVSRGAAEALTFEFEEPADGLEFALRILREIYDELPNDLSTEERLKLHEFLIDKTYLLLILFLDSDQDKAKVEEYFSFLDSEDLFEDPTAPESSEPSLN